MRHSPKTTTALLLAGILALGACGGDDGGGVGVASGGGGRPEAPYRNSDAGNDDIGSPTNPAEVGQWFAFRGDWSARIASVVEAGPGDLSEEPMGGGQAYVLTVEVEYDGDDEVGDDMYFRIDTDSFDEGYCADAGAGTGPIEVPAGETVEVRFCRALAEPETRVRLDAYWLQSQDDGAYYLLERP